MSHFTFSVLKLGANVLIIELIAAFGKSQPILSKEALAEKNANRTGDFIELSRSGKSSLGASQDCPMYVAFSTLYDSSCKFNHYENNAERGNQSQRSVSSRTLSARVGSLSNASQNRKRGMVLPFQPLSMTFNEIRYAIEMPQVP